MTDRLRALWDFDDLDGTEARLRSQLSAEEADAGRAEVTAELARVCGLRGSFEEGDTLLDDARALGGDVPAVNAQIDLERGRLRRSAGRLEAAFPHFVSAFEKAVESREWFLAADAAHMAALVAREEGVFAAWTERGIALAEEHEEAAYWSGPLSNNIGWMHYDDGHHDLALDAFESALRAREREPDKPEPIALARYAVGKTLRGLGRSEEAIPLLEQAVAWTEREDAPDGWFHEELAEEYAAVGRAGDAREQARLAIPILQRDDPSFAGDADRRERLDSLASDGAPTG